MKQLSTVRRRIRASLVVAAAAAIALSACADEAADTTEAEVDEAADTTEAEVDESIEDDPDPVTLSFTTPLPENHPVHLGFWNWVDMLEEEAPWVEIDFRGGPEVMGAFDQFDAVRAGSIDGAPLPEVYYDAQVPPVAMMGLSPYMPWEERENGIFEMHQQWHSEVGNVHYLGKVYAGIPFVLFTNEPVDGADLSGQIIRSAGANAALVEALGGESLNLPPPELYTALERGTVDGYIFASVGSADASWHEVVDYEISPRFFTTNMNLIINEDTWNSLDERTQQVLAETAEANEHEVVEMYQDLAVTEIEAYRDAGVELVELSADDEARFLEAAYTEGWEGIGWDSIVAQSPVTQEIRDLFEEGYGEDFVDAVPGREIFE